MSAPLVCGLDLGTGGARALIVDAGDGRVLARGTADLPGDRAARPLPAGHHEQDPERWWRVAREALAQALALLDRGPRRRAELAALAVDGTSGTLVGLDGAGAPVTPGLMYDDQRGAAVIDALRARAGADADGHAALAPSSALARAAWLSTHQPATWQRVAVVVHQADFVAGRLTGRHALADTGNALKLGCDPASGRWATWLGRLPELAARLPTLVPSGDVLAPVDRAVADALGLPATLVVVAGLTDGTAAALASGASQPGEDATTLGTTLVFKRVADAPLRDSSGLLYAHALPDGRWLPGAASSVGAGWIRQRFAGADPAALDGAARPHLPATKPCYPLVGAGERFPFRAPKARGFPDDWPDDPAAAWALGLTGTAHVERLGYAVLDRLTGVAAGTRPVHATGGGAASDVWLQLRADVCGRPFRRPAEPGSAFGAALLAAAAVHHGDLRGAAAAMVRHDLERLPDDSRRAQHDEYHGRFVAALVARGHLPAEEPS